MIGESEERKGIKDMVTVQAAARMLGVTHNRVLQFIEAGRLSATKVTPRLYLLDPADVRRFSRIPRKPGRKPKNLA